MCSGATGNDSLPAELSSTYFSYSSPDGRIVLSLTPATAATAASFEMGLLDIDACLAGNCAVTPLIGFPNWSPDGQHTLMISAENLAYLGAADGTIIRELGPALNFWAYWLNATTFGWTRPRQDVLGRGRRHDIPRARAPPAPDRGVGGR